MTTIMARGIDEKALFVVTTKRGDVIITKRFTTLAEADDFVTAIGNGLPDDGLSGLVRGKGGSLATFNRPVGEM